MAYPLQNLQFLTNVRTSEVWKTIVSAISTITDEAQFEADPKGIGFRCKDRTKEAFLDIFIPENTFRYYHCPELIRFGILAGDLLRAIKRLYSHDSVELFIQDRFLVIRSKGDSELSYKLNLIESKPPASSLKKMTFDTKLTIKTEMLASILDDIKVLSSRITLKTIHGRTTTTTFDSVNDTGLALVTIGQKYDNPNVQYHSSSLQKCQGSYSVGPMSQLLNLIGGSCEFVELEYSNERPLRLKVQPFECVVVQLYLAPQAEI